MPPVLLDYTVADGKTQACSLADRLGGVKRIKDMGQMFWRDTHPVVFEMHLNLFASQVEGDS